MANTASVRERGRRQVALLDIRTRIRELYESDYTDEEIAGRVSIHRTQVTRIRNEMGLPPRWGRRNGHVFTARHDSDLRELKGAPGLTWAQIAFLLDNRPVSVVYARWQMLLTRDSGSADTRAPETIKCMQCREYFVSPNRRQIHCCDACHRRIESLGNSFDN